MKCNSISTKALLLTCVVAPCAVLCAPGPPCSEFGIECRTGRGSIDDSILNLTEVVWVGPEFKQIFVGSPSIWRIPGSGELVASHDFFFETLNDTVQVFIDRTGKGDAAAGAVWENAGNVSGMYWANLFSPPADTTSKPNTQAPLYLLGVSGADRSSSRSIVISRSDDKGMSWTDPSVLLPFTATNNYHCAPTPTLTGSDGRLYRAFENGSKYDALMISTKEPYTSDTNLLDPDTWQATPSLPFDQVSQS